MSVYRYSCARSDGVDVRLDRGTKRYRSRPCRDRHLIVEPFIIFLFHECAPIPLFFSVSIASCSSSFQNTTAARKGKKIVNGLSRDSAAEEEESWRVKQSIRNGVLLAFRLEHLNYFTLKSSRGMLFLWGEGGGGFDTRDPPPTRFFFFFLVGLPKEWRGEKKWCMSP